MRDNLARDVKKVFLRANQSRTKEHLARTFKKSLQNGHNYLIPKLPIEYAFKYKVKVRATDSRIPLFIYTPLVTKLANYHELIIARDDNRYVLFGTEEELYLFLVYWDFINYHLLLFLNEKGAHHKSRAKKERAKKRNNKPYKELLHATSYINTQRDYILREVMDFMDFLITDRSNVMPSNRMYKRQSILNNMTDQWKRKALNI